MWIGTASASTQIEGAAPRSDWKRWESEGRVPPSGDGNGFAARYADDFALLAGTGAGAGDLSVVRLTLEWARLEPQAGQPDDVEFDRYGRVLRAARDSGLSPWACLHHVSLPGWFSDDEGGFLRDERRGRYLWSRYVDLCAEAFGDLVVGWQPIHDPAGYAAGAFRDGTLPPGRRDDADHGAVLRTVTRAATDAARLLRGGAPVAASLSALPADWDDVEDFDVVGLTHAGGPVGELVELVHRVADAQPDRPIVVTWGTPVDDDDGHVDRISQMVAALADAGVEGLLYWSAIDGYEFHRGFGVRYGLFDRDRRPREASLDVLSGKGS